MRGGSFTDLNVHAPAGAPAVVTPTWKCCWSLMGGLSDADEGSRSNKTLTHWSEPQRHSGTTKWNRQNSDLNPVNRNPVNQNADLNPVNLLWRTGTYSLTKCDTRVWNLGFGGS